MLLKIIKKDKTLGFLASGTYKLSKLAHIFLRGDMQWRKDCQMQWPRSLHHLWIMKWGENLSEGEFKVSTYYDPAFFVHKVIVFCCIAACIQPDISGCQQDFLVVWRWHQLRTFSGILENNFTDFREAVSLEKIFEIVQENTLKCSKLIHF